MTEKICKTEDQWRRELSPEQYHILREKGTERAFTGEYAQEKTPGVYRCAACGQELFASDTKFESGSGWPSFYQPQGPDRVETHEDATFGMRRVEVTCSRCDSHLGHVFPDGPRPTGMRYCINSASLKLDPKRKEEWVTSPANSKPHVTVRDALELLPASGGKRSIAVFGHGTLEVKMYAPRGADPQTPHSRDEVYVVAQGRGMFNLNGAREPFQPGDFLFAPAGVEHRFEDFTDDFATWVLFYGPEGGEAKRAA